MSPNEDVSAAAAKALPAVSGALYAGMSLNEWVAIATLIYIALQIGLLMPKYWRWWRGQGEQDGQ